MTVPCRNATWACNRAVRRPEHVNRSRKVVPHRRSGYSPGLMAEVLLFHPAQGLTPGVVSFADRLRTAGHVVHTPDLYDGKTFTDLADGVGYAKQVGFGTIDERGRLAADSLPNEIVYAGFSLGVMMAQMLAQTRPGARGALLFYSW